MSETKWTPDMLATELERELYTLLKEYADWAQSVQDDPKTGDLIPSALDRLQRARTALAKARGEKP